MAEDGSRSIPTGVKWESSVPRIATVDVRGRVRALRQGRTVISAAHGNQLVRVRLTVLAPVNVPPTITSLELTPPEGRVEAGKTMQFALTARLSSGAVEPAVVASWVSSDTSVGRISADGLLTARKARRRVGDGPGC